jgi:2,4-dichlorophenol 6-monooxygenase
LNTGVGDVHNLIWKIKTCLRNPEQSALLDTYEQERKPIAQRACDVSVNNNEKMEEVLYALGLDPSKAPLLQKIMSSTLIRMLPKSVQNRLRAILVGPVRKRLAQAAADDKQGQGVRERTAQAIAGQEEHFNTIGLQLGSIYEPNLAIAESSALVCHPEVSSFVAKACIGARLPHVTIALPVGKTSTLDLLDYSGYTLVTNGPSRKGPDATQVFEQAINILRLDDAQLDPHRAEIETAFELAAGDWLLVRPDGVIADRSQIKA